MAELVNRQEEGHRDRKRKRKRKEERGKEGGGKEEREREERRKKKRGKRSRNGWRSGRISGENGGMGRKGMTRTREGVVGRGVCAGRGRGDF